MRNLPACLSSCPSLPDLPLAARLVLGLCNLFGKLGKGVLILLLAGGIILGFCIKTKLIDRQLERERSPAVVGE